MFFIAIVGALSSAQSRISLGRKTTDFSPRKTPERLREIPESRHRASQIEEMPSKMP